LAHESVICKYGANRLYSKSREQEEFSEMLDVHDIARIKQIVQNLAFKRDFSSVQARWDWIDQEIEDRKIAWYLGYDARAD
jgi:hypothetical protein